MSESNVIAPPPNRATRKAFGSRPEQPRDDRLASNSLVSKVMKEPAIGALFAAIFIFVLFTVSDSTANHLWTA